MLPPPFPENSPQEERIVENDRAPPQIEILTTELHEGKNVFKVRITDESSLRTREVKYVHNGQLRIDGLFREQNMQMGILSQTLENTKSPTLRIYLHR
jgi:hypothetical protein